MLQSSSRGGGGRGLPGPGGFSLVRGGSPWSGGEGFSLVPGGFSLVWGGSPWSRGVLLGPGGALPGPGGFF